MISHKIVFTDSALKDLEIIASFISLYSPSTAEYFVFTILLRTNQLGSFPKSGQVEPILQKSKFEYRYIVEKHCKIIYRIDDSIIYIERIFDTRQNPIKLKKRNNSKK